MIKAELQNGQLRKRIAALEADLQDTVERIETGHEELQTANEELLSTNEELQATNEELQALNDELRDSGIDY